MSKKGKYVRKKKNTAPWIIAIVAVLALVIALCVWQSRDTDDQGDDMQQGSTEQINTEPTDNTQIDYELPTMERPDPMKVVDGLEIEKISSYVGVYMEDGSDEIVSNVMMLILKNTGEQDLQLAQIKIIYEGFTAEFEASNIPAGERVVLLEKNRAPMPEGEPQSVETGYLIFFQEPMSIYADKFEITGGDGYLDVTNISGEDVTGLIRVFYKNASKDLLYGGITYMATVQDGIPAGQTIRIVTGHYSQSGSRIIHVVFGE